MRVGLTYDLSQEYLARGFSEEDAAEFDRVETIEAIERALQDLGHVTDRIGSVQSLTQRLVAGERWDLVFNIAEGVKGFGREAQVPALLEAYDVPYTFSDPLVLSLTLHKGMTKRVIRDLGIPTPDFVVVENEADAAMVNLPFPLFAKPVAEGTGKGITAASKIMTREQLASVCRTILEKYKQPALVETFLPGREFTVGVLGTGAEATALGTVEVILRKHAEADGYSFLNKKKWEDLVEYPLVKGPLVEQAEEIAVAAYRGLGCRDAARVDLRVDANGMPNFMEINPLAGIDPRNSDLCFIAYQVGMTYGDLIGRIISSAVNRYSSESVIREQEDRHNSQRTRPLGTHLLGSLH